MYFSFFFFFCFETRPCAHISQCFSIYSFLLVPPMGCIISYSTQGLVLIHLGIDQDKKTFDGPTFWPFFGLVFMTRLLNCARIKMTARQGIAKRKKKRQGRASRLDADQLKENCSQQRRRRRLARPGRVNERSNRSRSLGFSLFFFFYFSVGFFFLPWVFSHI
jgi:hypothetical protein